MNGNKLLLATLSVILVNCSQAPNDVFSGTWDESTVSCGSAVSEKEKVKKNKSLSFSADQIVLRSAAPNGCVWEIKAHRKINDEKMYWGKPSYSEKGCKPKNAVRFLASAREFRFKLIEGPAPILELVSENPLAPATCGRFVKRM